jgi:hypothetical protein
MVSEVPCIVRIVTLIRLPWAGQNDGNMKAYKTSVEKPLSKRATGKITKNTTGQTTTTGHISKEQI